MQPEPLGSETIRVDNNTTLPRVGFATIGFILVCAFLAMLALVVVPVAFAIAFVYLWIQIRKLDQIEKSIAHWR